MTRTITVKGVGSFKAKPDYVVISMNIESKDKDYAKAVENANKRINILEQTVSGIGFEKGSIKTTRFGVSAQYENKKDAGGSFKRVFAGYSCSYSLKLGFDFDSGRLAETLTSIAECEAEPMLNISFTIKDPANANEELLTSAAKNARRKAEILCAASGEELGRLISINYDWSEPNLVSRAMYDAGAECMSMMRNAVPQMEPDDIELSDTAAFVWEIRD